MVYRDLENGRQRLLGRLEGRSIADHHRQERAYRTFLGLRVAVIFASLYVGMQVVPPLAYACEGEPEVGVELDNIGELNFGGVKTTSEKTVGFVFLNKSHKVKFVKEEVNNTKGTVFTKGAENCVTNTLEPPGMCEIQVEFQPTVIGEIYKAELVDEYKDLTNGSTHNQKWFMEGKGE